MPDIHDEIRELEEEFNLELDSGFDTLAYLCYHEHCNENCDCWDDLRSAVRGQLEKQQRDWEAYVVSMKRLYDGEVKAGIHVPARAEYREL